MRSDHEALVQQGLASLKSGCEEEILPRLTNAANAARDARLWQVVALLHRGLDDLKSSIAAFEKAAEISPDNLKIAHGRAHATLEAGLPAVSLFRHAERLAPDNLSVSQGLVSALLAEKGARTAINYLAGLVRAKPDWSEGQALLARLRWMTGERHGFDRSLVEALKHGPGNIDLWRQLLAVRMQASDYDGTLRAIADGRGSVGDHAVFSYYEAMCLSEGGYLEDAERCFLHLPEPADTGFGIYRVRHLLRSGRPAYAAQLSEGLIQKPGGEALWPYLAVAWRQLGDPRWNWLEGDDRLVGVYDIADRLPPLRKLADILRSLHRTASQPLDQSVRGGSQTDGRLFSRIEPEIRTVRRVVEEAVQEHIRRLPSIDGRHPVLSRKRGGRIRFAESWSVRLGHRGNHANHVHPRGWFSSALYIDLPAENERGPSPAGWLSLGTPDEKMGLDLTPIRYVEPKLGRLVLFPSTMWHGTMPFASGERLTIAFDVAPPI